VTVEVNLESGESMKEISARTWVRFRQWPVLLQS